MLEKEILRELAKISKQLEEVAQAQQEIKAEIAVLHLELARFEEFTLQNLEDQILKAGSGNMLN